MKWKKKNSKVIFVVMFILIVLDTLIIALFPDSETVLKWVLGISLLVLLVTMIVFYDKDELDYN